MLNEYINHSGGAVGADTEWDEIGKKFGMVNNNHYYIGNNKTPRGNFQIDSNYDFAVIDGILKYINRKYLKRTYPTKNAYVNSLLRRNAFQILNSEATYAIGTITDGIVNGGTAWAVYFGVHLGHPTYVFEQNVNKWYIFDILSDKFIEYNDIPILTKQFAGIGTREINELGKQAIEKIYEKTISYSTNI